MKRRIIDACLACMIQQEGELECVVKGTMHNIGLRSLVCTNFVVLGWVHGIPADVGR